MLRVGRRGLLSRFGVKSPQLSWNGFIPHRGVSVLNGMFYGCTLQINAAGQLFHVDFVLIGNVYGLQSSQSHSPIIFTKGM